MQDVAGLKRAGGAVVCTYVHVSRTDAVRAFQHVAFGVRERRARFCSLPVYPSAMHGRAIATPTRYTSDHAEPDICCY